MAARKNNGKNKSKAKAKTKAQVAAEAKLKAGVETEEAEVANEVAAGAIADAKTENKEADDAVQAAAVAVADADASFIEDEALVLQTEPDIIGNGKSSEKKAEKETKKFIKVRPKFAAMYEPFQRVRIPEGVDTPLVKSQWVEGQLAAGLLREC